ncbi:MAG: hypothetical protein OES09_04685 [Gammaproteobacteria bacterium]|nr:hypothetical protein [Gammaproteobacteria bacterium]
MVKIKIWLFCMASLLATVGISTLLFPAAALSPDAVERANTPQPMEELPEIDLGPDFGPVPVIELVGYYLENPPQPKAVAAKEERRHFGGC